MRNQNCRRCIDREYCSASMPPLIGRCSIHEQKDGLLARLKSRMAGPASIRLRRPVTVECDDVCGSYPFTVRRVFMTPGTTFLSFGLDGYGNPVTEEQLSDADLERILAEIE